MKPAVRQTRGPGMNRGMKKPRKKPGEPKPYTPSRAMTQATKAGKSTSYLPSDPLVGLGKPRARKSKAPNPKFL
jgi:hypothetical protein